MTKKTNTKKERTYFALIATYDIKDVDNLLDIYDTQESAIAGYKEMLFEREIDSDLIVTIANISEPKRITIETIVKIEK